MNTKTYKVYRGSKGRSHTQIEQRLERNGIKSKKYKLFYRPSNEPSNIQIHVATRSTKSKELMLELEELGFVCSYDGSSGAFYSATPKIVMLGHLQLLEPVDIKPVLKKYDQDGTIITVDIVYDYKELAEIYPSLFKMVKPYKLKSYINRRNANGILHIELSEFDKSGIFRDFDLESSAFHYYTISGGSRIVIENENQLRKFKLLGMLDCLLDYNKRLDVMFTAPLMKHMTWKL